MWMPVIVMIEENQHPILYWHGETGKTFFPDMYSLKELLWLFLSELAEWQRFLVLRLPLQSVKFQSDNCKDKGWCPYLQTPSSWAKLQKEWILHIVRIACFNRICVLLACDSIVFWMSECNVMLALSVRERETEIVVHICCLLYIPYARGLLRPRTHRLARAPCFGCSGGAGGGSWGNWRLDLDFCLWGIQSPKGTFFREATHRSHKTSGPAWPPMASEHGSATSQKSCRVAHIDAWSKPAGSSLEKEGVGSTTVAFKCCTRLLG